MSAVGLQAAGDQIRDGTFVESHPCAQNAQEWARTTGIPPVVMLLIGDSV